MAQELAALNKELGLQALYQNHAGTKYVGASLWDLDLLMEGIEPTQMAVGFDIRHATVEGGTTWATLWKLIEPRLGAVYVKDFVWEGRKMKNVPLGSGMVEPKFFSDLAKHRADVPFTVHVEYLEHADTVENIAALKHDLATLKKLLGIS
jgi:sugar phosphate isomerase/epimerase